MCGVQYIWCTIVVIKKVCRGHFVVMLGVVWDC